MTNQTEHHAEAILRDAGHTPMSNLTDRERAMLEALEALISELEHKGSDGWMTGNVHGDDYDRARAAIALATGDKP